MGGIEWIVLLEKTYCSVHSRHSVVVRKVGVYGAVKRERYRGGV